MNVGKKIKAARQAAGFTQAQAAEKLMVSRQSVSNWENGKTYPDIDSVVRMSELYSVSLDDIMKDGEQPEDAGDELGREERIKATAIILAVYLFLWGFSMFSQCANISATIAAEKSGEVLDTYFLYDSTIYFFVLPVATFIMAAVIGRFELWGRYRWLIVPVCGVLNMLPEYVPQAYYWYAVNRPPLYPSVWGLLSGVRPSLFGLICGMLLKKRINIQLKINKNKAIITLLSLALILTAVYFTTYRSYMNWDYSDGVLTISGRGAADPKWDKKWQEKWKYEGRDVREIVVETGISRLEENMLDCFPNVEKIVLPSTMNSINSTMFEGQKLKEIEIDPGNTGFKSVNGAVLDDKGGWLYHVPPGITGTFAVPEGVTTISSLAFSHCYGLKSVILPDTAETIMSDAFYWCASGMEITIPTSVTSIDDDAMMGSYVIIGYRGSAAEEYAERTGRRFVEMG